METIMEAPEQWNHFEDDLWMDAVLREVESLHAADA